MIKLTIILFLKFSNKNFILVMTNTLTPPRHHVFVENTYFSIPAGILAMKLFKCNALSDYSDYKQTSNAPIKCS